MVSTRIEVRWERETGEFHISLYRKGKEVIRTTEYFVFIELTKYEIMEILEDKRVPGTTITGADIFEKGSPEIVFKD